MNHWEGSVRTRASHPSRLDVSVWGRVGSQLRLGVVHHGRNGTYLSLFHPRGMDMKLEVRELEKEEIWKNLFLSVWGNAPGSAFE